MNLKFIYWENEKIFCSELIRAVTKTSFFILKQIEKAGFINTCICQDGKVQMRDRTSQSASAAQWPASSRHRVAGWQAYIL
jgi:hypothetical protein